MFCFCCCCDPSPPPPPPETFGRLCSHFHNFRFFHFLSSLCVLVCPRSFCAPAINSLLCWSRAVLCSLVSLFSSSCVCRDILSRCRPPSLSPVDPVRARRAGVRVRVVRRLLPEASLSRRGKPRNLERQVKEQCGCLHGGRDVFSATEDLYFLWFVFVVRRLFRLVFVLFLK